MAKQTDNIFIYNRLAVALKELRITQKELARRTGLTKTAISNICRNVHQPSIKGWWHIGEAMGVDYRTLLISNLYKNHKPYTTLEESPSGS